MPRAYTQSELPLLTAILPAHVTRLLLASGLPVRELATAHHLASNQTNQCVLFDSSNRSSRKLANAAAACGAQTIDIVALSTRQFDTLPRNLSQNEFLDSASAEWLCRLKGVLESRRCPWIRLSDYPFPYQSVLVENESSANSCNAIVADDQRTLSLAYLAGFPIARSAEPRFPAITTEQPTAPREVIICDDLFPLLWRTTSCEFESWLSIRKSLSLFAVKDGTKFTLHARGAYGGFRPAVEVWRGTHFAVIPIKDDVMEIQESDLVFRSAGFRNCGGTAVMKRREESISTSQDLQRRSA